MTAGEDVWEAAVALLAAAPDVALACHMRPDGDALGSMLALHLALRRRGVRTTVSWSADPFHVPAHYSFLPAQDTLTEPADFPVAPALLVTFDTGSIDRLGVLAPVATWAENVLVIDHHVSNTRYGTVNLIDENAAGSVVIVAELLRRLGEPIDRDIATCLYTGLTTDTGSFRFSTATAEVHELAARLIRTGIRHDLINLSIWDTQRFMYVKLLSRVLERAVLEPELELIWTYVTIEDLTEFGVLIEEIESIIDVIRTTAEAQVAIVCKQDVDGRFAVSMRSKGSLDIGSVAVECGGGGHRQAAGFTSDETVEEIMKRIRKELMAADPSDT